MKTIFFKTEDIILLFGSDTNNGWDNYLSKKLNIMVQIGNVPEIKAVKKHLEELKEKGLVKEWELPYENILTRLTAAIFFLTPNDDSKLEVIWKDLESHKMLQYRLNKEKKLSQLVWRVEFNKGFEL